MTGEEMLDARIEAARAHKRALDLRIARATALRDLAEYRESRDRGPVIAGFAKTLALKSVARYRSLKGAA